MTDFKSLQVLDYFKPLFLKVGIDYEMMRKILQLKLMMDSRRMPTIFNGSKVKKEGNQFLKSLWLYGLYGLLMLTPFLFFGNDYIFQMSIIFSLLMFILMSSMVSDFSAVLLDIRDKTILHTKPISNRTLNAAKVVHIMIYMFLLTGSFVVIPLVVSIFKHGIVFALIFIIEIVLICCLVVVLTAFAYLFILRFFSGEKLKDIINYVQIILSIGIMVSYQLVARSFEIVNLKISYVFEWWHLLLPPIWYGAPFELLLHQNYSTEMIILSVLAFVGPILSIALYIRLMPAFERNLTKLLSDSSRRKKKSQRMVNLWSKILCRTEEERTFYRFSTLMMRQERELKLKIYPQLGFALILPPLFIFSEIRTRSFEEITSGNGFMFIYFSLLVIPTVVHMLKFSSNYKGHWIYRAAPIQNEAVIYSGTLKACIVNFFLPIFVVLSVILTAFFSLDILPDLFVVLLVAIMVTLIAFSMMNGEVYPFSNAYEHTQDMSTFKVFATMFIIGFLAFLHFVISKIPYGLYGYMILLIVTIFITWRVLFPKKISEVS
ncbi:hypothetical protein [Psychrobacillus sp.]|uniref:hypothetical protein n=1 Tax=Psychrobacillus sp. TaxID=1871623 RepID=UPI0028BEF4C0|nr:hypothetical protein [Psychrobacillus sp.]